MPLSPTEIALIRDSYDALLPEVERASTAFYAHLFEVAPELQDLFRTDMADQGMKLMTAIGMIVRLLEEPEALGDRLARLGEGHAALGVERAHFKPFGAALSMTLEDVLGDRLTAEARDAWQHAYAEIAVGVMKGFEGDGSGGAPA